MKSGARLWVEYWLWRLAVWFWPRSLVAVLRRDIARLEADLESAAQCVAAGIPPVRMEVKFGARVLHLKFDEMARMANEQNERIETLQLENAHQRELLRHWPGITTAHPSKDKAELFAQQLKNAKEQP